MIRDGEPVMHVSDLDEWPAEEECAPDDPGARRLASVHRELEQIYVRPLRMDQQALSVVRFMS